MASTPVGSSGALGFRNPNGCCRCCCGCCGAGGSEANGPAGAVKLPYAAACCCRCCCGCAACDAGACAVDSGCEAAGDDVLICSPGAVAGTGCCCCCGTSAAILPPTPLSASMPPAPPLPPPLLLRWLLPTATPGGWYGRRGRGAAGGPFPAGCCGCTNLEVYTAARG